MLLSSIERIVKSDTRYYNNNKDNNNGEIDVKKKVTYKKEQQLKRLETKFDRLFAQRREVVLQERLNSLSTSRASKCAISGDEFNLRKEMLLGHPVNEVDARSGRTVLLEAVAGGYLHLVRMLIIDFNADVNCITMLGKTTPLHIAVENGQRQIASMLITYGANLNARDMYGRTPLHNINKISVFKLLMKFPGIDICAKDNKGFTPLSLYLQKTPLLQRDNEIVYILSNKEDKKIMEITREQVATAKEIIEHKRANWGVTDDSTMRFYNEEKSKPW